MNLTQAYKELGIPESSSKEEARKAFKNLAKKYHPDVNKEEGAEVRFKRIGEAWGVIDTGEASTREERQAEATNGWGFNIQDIINGFTGAARPVQKKIFAQDITLPETLSFKEAVIGCQRDITYKRNVRCSACEGVGKKTLDNGCSICHGSGKSRTQRGNMIMESSCGACRGKINYADCDKCKTEGFVGVETTISVNIPPGAVEGSLLNLGPRGHYLGDMFGAEQNTRLALLIHVLPQEGLSIQDKDVISQISISLLEALQGCQKTIDTIDGNKEITIPQMVKNKETVSLPKLGVARQGDQVITINVQYPEKIEVLIEALQKEI